MAWLTVTGMRIASPTGATIVYVVGARPNFVKMAPVASEMRLRAPHLRHIVVHTGQHFDREMSDLFFDDLDLSEPDYLLGVGSGSHGAQTGRALERIEDVLLRERPRLVVVPGDVNSTLAAALAAAKLGIPVAHVEAGLRSFDRTMPEELNRVLVDQIAEWCLIHSPEAEENLVREGIDRSRVHFVGNTMIDSLVRLLPRAKESTVLDRLELTPGDFLLVTLHRPSLVDGSALAGIAGGLVELSRTIPLVFPVHPRTRARLAELELPSGRMKLIEPLGYIDFLALEASARGVITDSGGVQEETTFLQVPCFTLRANTERPITVRQGTNRLLGLDPDALGLIPTLLERPRPARGRPAGWEGSASVRAARVLLDGLDVARQTPERDESRVVAVGRTR
jgi:UDP-N-acetylglucosamine 2-epimerase (non-hydrolysing)